MDRSLLPIVFRDLDTGTSAWLVFAALAAALLCPPLVLAFLLVLLPTAETAAGLSLPVPVALSLRRPWTRRLTLRGPPTR